MIEKIKFIVSMCFFGTSYVSLDFKADVVNFFISLIISAGFLILIHKIHTRWQHGKNAKTKLTD